MCRGWQFVDPQKEVAAYKEAVSCGFKTQADVIAEQGGDIEDLYKARAYEMELAEEYGLKFATDAEVAAPTVDEDPQQLEAPDEPEESDGGDPEENGTEGD
jgi:capsid protein